MTAPIQTPDSGEETLPQRRGLLTYLIDRIFLWLLGFPPERCTYTTQSLRIPLSNGIDRIELAADLFRPTLPSSKRPLGTLLLISPYGRGFPIRLVSDAFAARGYQVLMVSSRGTFGSAGSFYPFRDEVEDGKRIVEWMRRQPWYTGTFATIGGSYLSFTQWGLMMSAPRDLVAAVTSLSVHDASRVCWDSGALNLDIVRWAGGIATQEESSFTWKAFTRPKLEPIIRSVPLAQNVRQHLSDNCRWLDHMIATSDIHNPHYAPMQLKEAMERINIPVLIVTGWYDIFLENSTEQYVRLRERGVPVSITSGPWSHIKCALNAKTHLSSFDGIEEHVGGRAEAKRPFPVDYFVTGAKEWRQLDTWPTPCKPVTFYLQANGNLAQEPAENRPRSSSFIFDPRDPTPTVGGNALLSSGAVDDRALAQRKDVLVFDSHKLEDEFKFCGKATIELDHCKSHPHADVFVRLSDVKANGKSTNVTEAYRRLNPKRNEDERVHLALNHTSHRFLRGRKIRLVVAGGNFPQYTRNLGFSDASNKQSEMRSVQHTIRFSAANPSKIIFPKILCQ
ncbi:hypothetical protein OPT61_g4204 [Boeremia exigua]|uniref:Uncharacterized protein n=1 Tax=Boeremia exigua TaxID=749465 RepID=A0ACC2IF34_9PLEO|nr:hypothetical protein OPT61_g4204 [Boeremia exigua]